jgi:hypothetical protein
MDEWKRINLRIPPNDFRQLSAKAGLEGLTFQKLGYGWFMEWLEGRRSAPCPPEFAALSSEESSKLLAVLEFMRNPGRVAQEFRSVLESSLESIHYLLGRPGKGEETGQGEGEGREEGPGPGDKSSGET